MAYWLVKTEPTAYSFAQLVKDKKTAWTGVSNALARRHLSAMKKGDWVLVYHTGTQKAVVGKARVVREAYSDHDADPKSVAVDLQAQSFLTSAVTLQMIKADPRFAQWSLVTMGRLSVVPTTQQQFEAVLELAQSSSGSNGII